MPPVIESTRHDQVWLVQADESMEEQAGEKAARVADWVRAGRPFVVAHQAGIDPDRIRLGLTLPAIAGAPRSRLALIVPRAMIVRLQPPPLLAEAIAISPETWRERLRDVGDLAARCGFAPRVYGSLAAELATGERFLTTDSDVDLLFDWRGESDLMQLLDGLARFGDVAPRLDGEVRRADGRAVAWRELVAALRGGGSARVLAKSDTAAELMMAAEFVRL
jgi:phosphoribosyl-dephospho-CoA transferase